MSSPQVFISYSRNDKAFADRLQRDLLGIGVSVWKDTNDIRPGDSISSQIERAIVNSDFFFFVLSLTSISSHWVDTEYRLALNSQIAQGRPRIVPILLHDVEPPSFLRDVHCANFVNDYAPGWRVLSKLFPPSDLRDLKVGGATGTGIYVLKFFITKFKENFPDLPIEEKVDTSGELIKEVASGALDTSLDAAVVGGVPNDAYKQIVEYEEVFRDISVLTVYRDHPLWGIESISEDHVVSLFEEDPIFVSRPQGSGSYQTMRNYLEPRLGESRTEHLLSRFVAYDLDSARRFVSERRGISIMPNIIICEDVLSGNIWPVRLPGNVQRTFYGIWPKDRCRSAASEEFIGLLRAGLE